jgi:hypothetical protein
VLLQTARSRTAGASSSDAATDHHTRLEALFDVLRNGVAPRP